MSFASTRADIETRFKTNWYVSSPSVLRTPIQFDRQAFTPPDSSAWVSLTIIDGRGANASIGAPGVNLVRYVGVVAIKITVPGGEGSAAARALLDAASDIFRNWFSSGLRFGIPYPGDPIEAPPVYSVTLFCPFERDEKHG